MQPPLRLGFPVKVVGQSGLKSHDTRRWQTGPHLRVSLEYLHQVFDYLASAGISMYRMSSDLAPYVTHPDMPQFHGMIAECKRELRALGDRAIAENLRLSFHPSQYIVLNSPDDALVRKSIWDVEAQAEILDSMHLGPEAVVVIHVGGVYDDRRASCERWVRTWDRMSARARSRLVLENDDIRFGPADVLWIHDQTGVRLIFDHQHFWCLNPERLSLPEALGRMLGTWAGGQRPKIHFSSPATSIREIERTNRKTGKRDKLLAEPVQTHHADFANAFEFATFMRLCPDVNFDVMLESKMKDVAVLRLRRDLRRYAPDVACRFGIALDATGEPENEVILPAPAEE